MSFAFSRGSDDGKGDTSGGEDERPKVTGPGLVRPLSAPKRLGKGPPGPDKRLFKFDVIQGRAGQLPFEVTKDDRMSALEAGAKLQEIFDKCGLGSANADVLYTFTQALFIAHTVNSGSMMQPGRGAIKVSGSEFSYTTILSLLGEDTRRFFRAFADEIAEANRRVIDAHDPYDPVSHEMVGWIRQVAAERGLYQHPQYAHDSSDACLNIGPAVFEAIQQAKRRVLTTTTNPVAKASANSRVGSVAD